VKLESYNNPVKMEKHLKSPNTGISPHRKLKVTVHEKVRTP